MTNQACDWQPRRRAVSWDWAPDLGDPICPQAAVSGLRGPGLREARLVSEECSLGVRTLCPHSSELGADTTIYNLSPPELLCDHTETSSLRFDLHSFLPFDSDGLTQCPGSPAPSPLPPLLSSLSPRDDAVLVESHSPRNKASVSGHRDGFQSSGR